MPGLTIIDCPALVSVTKGALKVLNIRTRDTYFYQLAFVYEYLKVVSATLGKNLGAQRGFETVSIIGFTDKKLII